MAQEYQSHVGNLLPNLWMVSSENAPISDLSNYYVFTIGAFSLFKLMYASDGQYLAHTHTHTNMGAERTSEVLIFSVHRSIWGGWVQPEVSEENH